MLFLSGAFRVLASYARPLKSVGTTTQRLGCRRVAWKNASRPSPRHPTTSTLLPQSAWSPCLHLTVIRTYRPKNPVREHSPPSREQTSGTGERKDEFQNLSSNVNFAANLFSWFPRISFCSRIVGSASPARSSTVFFREEGMKKPQNVRELSFQRAFRGLFKHVTSQILMPLCCCFFACTPRKPPSKNFAWLHKSNLPRAHKVPFYSVNFQASFYGGQIDLFFLKI